MSAMRPKSVKSVKRPKWKRITVTVDLDIPVEMTIGETDQWVEGCFPASARAQCNEQRVWRAQDDKKDKHESDVEKKHRPR